MIRWCAFLLRTAVLFVPLACFLIFSFMFAADAVSDFVHGVCPDPYAMMLDGLAEVGLVLAFVLLRTADRRLFGELTRPGR